METKKFEFLKKRFDGILTCAEITLVSIVFFSKIVSVYISFVRIMYSHVYLNLIIRQPLYGLFYYTIHVFN